jgi:hypothetical protein
MPDYVDLNTAKFYEKQLLQKLIATNKQVKEYYRRFIQNVTPLIQQYRYNNRGIVIRDKDIEKAINTELERFKNDFQKYVETEKIASWQLAEAKTNDIISKWAGQTAAATIAEKGIHAQNVKAMESFMNRKVSGMNLSDRVWNLAANTKEQLEYYVQSGLAAGRGADVISRDIRQVLNEPDKRFRRIRDPKSGKLVPSKPMSEYHPGQGNYRSSYQNARRLAITEINMAYRQSDMDSWRDLDMVIGYEVKLSNNHPVTDICDDAKGKYPKSFNFIGWHPACRCYSVPILMPSDDFDNWVAGEPVNIEYQKDVPDGLKKWLNENKQRVEGWKNKPYFIEQNQGIVDRIYKSKPK